MESASVPSQSKISSLQSDGCTQALHSFGPHLVDWRLQLQLTAIRQRHSQQVGVQEQALAAQVTNLFAEAFIAVLGVTGNCNARRARCERGSGESGQ